MKKHIYTLIYSCLFIVCQPIHPQTDKQCTIDPRRLIIDSRSQIGVTVGYDPTYRRLEYPNGDVPIRTGVCTDVIIRAFRKQSLDLQKAMHLDMSANFSKYPQKWGYKKPDRNIDHRRVPNQMKWFERQGWKTEISKNKNDYKPGDLVTWDLGKGITHIGIVSDKSTSSNIPLIIHNIGAGTREENILFEFEITGHYRPGKYACIK